MCLTVSSGEIHQYVDVARAPHEAQGLVGGQHGGVAGQRAHRGHARSWQPHAGLGCGSGEEICYPEPSRAATDSGTGSYWANVRLNDAEPCEKERSSAE